MLFFMCELQKFFSFFEILWIINMQIFSLLLQVSDYGLHSVKFVYIEREYIFLHVYPQLIFLIGLCLFSLPHLPNFLQNGFFPKLGLFFLFL